MYGHLSRLTVADKLKRYSRWSSGGQPYATNTQSCSKWGLHGIPCYQGIGELLPRLFILTKLALRFISVALSLKSPSPDVIRHPVLCCSDFPHCVFTPRDRTANSIRPLYHLFSKKSLIYGLFSLFFLLLFFRKKVIMIVSSL